MDLSAGLLRRKDKSSVEKFETNSTRTQPAHICDIFTCGVFFSSCEHGVFNLNRNKEKEIIRFSEHVL
jgi:hypothetical protein